MARAVRRSPVRPIKALRERVSDMEGLSVAFKKHLTPMRPHARGMRGNVIKQRGKGSTQQDDTGGGPDTVTGGDPLQRMMNQYPKPPPPVRTPPPPTAPDQAEYDQSE